MRTQAGSKTRPAASAKVGASSSKRASPKGNTPEASRAKLIELYASWADHPTTLAPFADWYPESKKTPKFEKRTHEIPFEPSEAAIIHAEYWKAPPLLDFDGFIEHLQKSVPKLASARDRLKSGPLAKLFSALPESFPFSFRTRRLAATSHLLVEALGNAPADKSVSAVLRELGGALGEFPTAGSFQQASIASWQRKEHFPFVHEHLKRSKGGFLIEPRGKAPSADEVQRLPNGKLKMNEALAKRVADILVSNESIKYGWGPDQIEAVLDKALGGGFQYWILRRMREKNGFPDLLPSDEQVQELLKTRLAERIRALYDGGLTTPGEIFARLHKEGYPDWSDSRKVLSTLRKSPALDALIPRFKDEQSQKKTDESKVLLDAIIADGGQRNFTDIARGLGHSDADAKRLLEGIRTRWPDALPKQVQRAHGGYRSEPYTDADRQVLADVLAKAGLRPNFDQLLLELKKQHPEFMQRHPFPAGASLQSALSLHLGVEWRARDQKLYSELFAEVVGRFPPGTTFTKLVRTLEAEHPGAYGLLAAQRLAQSWKDQPKAWPAIAQWLDPKTGEFPWEKSRVTPTAELAQRVATEMGRMSGKSLDAVVKSLLSDEDFKNQYPGFTVEHVHILRREFGIIPFVVEKQSAAARATADADRKKLAKKLVAAMEKLPKGERPSAAALARLVGVGDREALSAVHAHSELFPWFKDRPLGVVDEYLAERVADEIRQASVTMSAADIVAKLKSDPEFAERYPRFSERHLSVLAARFDFVPSWMETRRILQSKLLVDALLTAPAGTSFSKVREGLEKKYPGRFSANLEKETLIDRWSSQPEKYPFAQVLAGTKGQWKLVGRGQKVEATSEDPATLAARLARLENLWTKSPLLERLATAGSARSLEKHELVLLQRMQPSLVPLLEQLRKLGLSPDRATVVALPDGSEPLVAEAISSRGWELSQPELDHASIHEAVRAALEGAIEASIRSGHPVLVVDDGDMAGKVLAANPELLAEASRIRIVNRREHDVTIAEAIAPDYTLATVTRAAPSNAATPAPEVEALMAQLAEAGIDSVVGKTIGILGADVGSAWAEVLRNRGATITLLDSNYELLAPLAKLGFEVERDTPEDRKRFFRRQDIVLVASDAFSVRAADLEVTKAGVVLGNLSRDALAIDLAGMKAKSAGTDPTVQGEAVQLELKDGRGVSVLQGGFPIGVDFADSAEATTPELLIGCLAGARPQHLKLPPSEGFVLREERTLKVKKPRKSGVSAIDLRASAR